VNLILSGLFIVVAFNMPEVVLRFVLVGELPDGTTLLSPDTMLGIILIGFLLMFILINRSFTVKVLSGLSRSSAKFRLPKRRYTSL